MKKIVGLCLVALIACMFTPWSVFAENSIAIDVNSTYSGTQVDNQKYSFEFSLPSSGYVEACYDATLDITEANYFEDNLGGHGRSSSWVAPNNKVSFSSSGYFSKGKYTYSFSNSGNGPFTIELKFTPAQESFPETTGGQNNSINEADPIQIGKQYSGLISMEDSLDIYSFEIAEDGFYSLEYDMLSQRGYNKIDVYNETGEIVYTWSYYFDKSMGESGEHSVELELQKGVHYLAIGELTSDGLLYSCSVNKHTHSYSDWTVTKEATCTADGSREKVCSVCGDKVTEIIPAIGKHNYGDWTVTHEATCTADGSREKACSVCGDKVTEVIPATGEHNYGDWSITKEATCTADGSREKACSVCGDKVTEAIPATGHKVTVLPAIDATCTETGKTAGKKCSVCGEILEPQKEIKAFGHDFCEWAITRVTTEAAAGVQTRVCSRCGEKETQEIAQLAPTLKAVKISKPKAAKKSATIKWKKLSKKNLKKIKKIEIQYSTDKNFTENVKSRYANAKKTSYKIKKLKSKKKYYVRIRAYTKSGGQVHVSKWSATKSFKVK